MTAVTRLELRGYDGLRLAADAVGDPANPPALLLHGGGQTRHSWGTTLRELGGAGWYAVSMDLRGHGDSEWASDGDYSLDAFTSDVQAVAGWLGRPAVVGASLGGNAGLAALGRNPADPVARALVLVDVSPYIESSGAERVTAFMRRHMEDGFGSLDEVADAIQEYNPHRPRPTNLDGLRKNVRQRADGRWVWHWDPAFVGGRFASSDETRVADPARQQAVLEGAAQSLRVPTLLVRGRQSDLLSEAGAREFLRVVPHAEYADVAGAGHMVAGDRNDAFNQAIFTFLETVRSTADPAEPTS